MANYKLYVSNAGVPCAGAVLAWEYLFNNSAVDEVSPPAFSELKGGHYIFSYSPTEAMAGVIDCDSDGAIGLSDADRYLPCWFTVNDENLDATISSRASAVALITIGASIDDIALSLVTIDAAVGDIQAVTDNIPNDGALTDIALALVTIDSVADDIKTVTDNLPNAGALTDISSALATIDATATAIKDKTDGLNFTGDDVKATLDGEEVDIGAVKGAGVTSVDDFKASVSGLSTFDSSSDEVDIGSVKGSAVTNIDDFKADVSNLDTTVSSRSTFDPSSDEVDIGSVKGAAVSGVNDFKADVSNLDAAVSSRSVFDASSDEVDIGSVKGAAVISINDFKANVSALATSAALSITDGKVTGIKTVTDKLASIDGLDPNTAFEIVLAMASGRFTKSSNTYTFYKQDNITVLFTLAVDAVTGKRTRS